MRCVKKYDKKGTVEQLSGTPDAMNEIDPTDDNNWSEYTTAYAQSMSKGGREFWKVDRVSADVSHVWLCPYDSTLAAATPAMRWKHDGDVYEILSVIDIDLAHEEIEIQTKRAV